MSDTRTDLMNSAETAVRARGFDAFSYADLAAAVGIRKASVHHHFPTKAELAVALMQRYAERHFANLDVIAARSSTSAEALLAFVNLYRGAEPDSELLCLCVAFSLSKQSLSESLHQEISGFQEQNIAWLRDQFSRGSSDRRAHSFGDPDAEAMACLALLEGAQILARTSGDVRHFDRAVAAFEQRLRTG